MAHLAGLLAVCIIALPYTLAQENAVVEPTVGNTTLESPKVTNWGSWGAWEYCPAGTYVTGMQLKTEYYQGAFSDDSGLNGVRFYCGPVGGNSDLDHPISSTVGPDGSFNLQYLCAGPANGFELRSENDLGWFNDDTAASNLRLYCDGSYKEGDGVSWGSWTGVQACPAKSAICALRTQVEPTNGDDTSLNNIQVLCCPVPDPSEHCTPEDTWDLLLECDNTEAVSDTSCTYERKIGASHWNMVSESNYLLYEMYSHIGFTLPGALANLPGNFGAQLGQSLVTQYNWTSSAGEVWKEETTVTVGISVPPGIRTKLYQTYGKCDFYAVRANLFKRVDSDSKFNTQEITFFEV